MEESSLFYTLFFIFIMEQEVLDWITASLTITLEILDIIPRG